MLAAANKGFCGCCHCHCYYSRNTTAPARCDSQLHSVCPGQPSWGMFPAFAAKQPEIYSTSSSTAKVLSQHEAFTEEARQEDTCSVLVKKPSSPAQTDSRLPENKETVSQSGLDPHAFRIPNHLEPLISKNQTSESHGERWGPASSAVPWMGTVSQRVSARLLHQDFQQRTWGLETPGVSICDAGHSRIKTLLKEL